MEFSQVPLDRFLENHEMRKKKEMPTKKEELIIKTEKINDVEVKAPLKAENADYLLSVEYNGKKGCAAARFYNPRDHSIHFWYDNSEHHPYCFSNIPIDELKKNTKIMGHKGFLDIEIAEKQDLLQDRTTQMTKIIAKDPLSIGGTTGAIRELLPAAWEANIPYHKCYIADLELTPGLLYEVNDERLKNVTTVPEKIKDEISRLFEEEPNEVKELLVEGLPLFLSPIPDIKRAAIDIEVISPFEDAIPRPEQANFPIRCISIVASDGTKRILLLESKDVERGDAQENLKDVSIEYFNEEKDLIEEIFRVFNEYPVILTYNGDKFDMLYLYNRALNHLRFRRDAIPIVIRKDFVALVRNIHVDLYRFFHNRAVSIYAFSGKYKTTDLNAVAKALLGIEKIQVKQPLSKLPLLELASYCYRDGEITLELTRYSQNLVWKLIMLLMRISHLPLEDVTRQGVSSWIQNLFYYEHRKKGYLIPRPQDIKEAKGEEASTQAIIKGKKYKGAIVIDPVPGVHFDVVVLDFASLYPSIIKVHNLSYETVRCPHEECKQNIIPDTDHWVCKKQRGLAGLIIGFLRDIRLKWFKPQSKNRILGKETQELFYVVQQALKLIINAFYGVFGAEHFPLYCLPVAESTTALGRHIITQTIKKAKKMDISVIYGDSVTEDMPILIRDYEGLIDFIPIEDAYIGLEVWSEEGWTSIKRVIRKPIRKRILRINTRHGVVNVTEDHSLLDIKGNEIKAVEIDEGMELLHSELPWQEVSIKTKSKEMAWLLGLFLAEGTCGKYFYPKSGVKYQWKIDMNDRETLENAGRIIEKEFEQPWKILDIRKSSGVYRLVPF
ncbi:MAG: DNA-directed DNA polymerase I, partial [Candidatus Lokiarchaeota archaeon]|nr:DNA-directed DNA polymerase I [Candidatus Lokiarchaeota archaeon]